VSAHTEKKPLLDCFGELPELAVLIIHQLMIKLNITKFEIGREMSEALEGEDGDAYLQRFKTWLSEDTNTLYFEIEDRDQAPL